MKMSRVVRSISNFRSAFLASFLLGMFPVYASGQFGPPKVLVKEARMQTFPRTVTLVGTVLPVRAAMIGSEVEGLVVELSVQQGQRVEKGEVLCRLKSDVAKTHLDEAQGRLASLKAMLAELEAGTRAEDLTRLKAMYDSEQAKFDRWSFERQRVTNLYGGSASNEREVQDTEMAYRSAEQMLSAAKADYEKALAGPRKEEIERARQDVAEQMAVVERYRVDLAKHDVKAPFSGYVGRKYTEVGEWIEIGAAVFELMDLSSVLVRVDAPETALPYARIGDHAGVRVDALEATGHSSFDGSIVHIMRQADPNARTFPIEIEVKNPLWNSADGKLLEPGGSDVSGEPLIAGGMFARVSLPAGPSTEFPAVPKDAVVRRDGVDYVAMIQRVDTPADGGSGAPQGGGGPPGQGGGGPSTMAIPIPVTTGAEADQWLAITSGNIHPGMEVVTLGNEGLAYPMPVIITDPANLVFEESQKTASQTISN